jgi:hypothetical protein
MKRFNAGSRLARAAEAQQSLSQASTYLLAVLLCASIGTPAAAVVPSGNLVPALGAAGNYNSAVRISNAQGGRGTATLFMSKPDPDNAAKNRNYYDMCFVTADHVMRIKGGGGPGDDDDTLPYDSNDNYGGDGPAAVQPGPAQLFGSIGVGSIGDPAGFSLFAGGGVVASKTVLGGGIALKNNKPTDIAFVGITVDLDALTPAQKATVLAMQVQPLAAPPLDPMGPGGAAFDFNVYGGYGVTGNVAAPPNNQYLYIQGFAGHAYGKERYFQNTVAEYKNVANGVYEYDAMKWVNGDEGPNVLAPGMGMQGDSGAAIFFNNNIIGILTAGRMDKVGLMGGGTGYLLKDGYYEYAAQMTAMSLANLTTLCGDYTYASATVPEPAAIILLTTATAILSLRRSKARHGDRN